MKLFQYESYEHYVKAQTEGNKLKIKNVYVEQKAVEETGRYPPSPTSPSTPPVPCVFSAADGGDADALVP